MNKKGFTLIELVIVIVILGILAAVAVPKFADLQKDAKISAVRGLGGAVRAAADIVKAKWLVNDNASATDVEIEGKKISVYNINDNKTLSGYPKPTSDGIGNAVDYDSDKFVTDNSSSSSGEFKFIYKGIDNASECGLIYYAKDDNFTITINTGGCE